MLFNAAIFCGLLFVPAALGLPSGLDARITRRREGRQSQVSDRLKLADGAASDASSIYNTEYTTNWAGAVWIADDGTFTSIVGTFTAPTLSGASRTSAAAWVGIDGNGCHTAILQTGVDFTVSSNGQPTYDAWYEWYPDYVHDFSGISISAGDTIKLNVTATSTTSGTAKIENTSNGQTVSMDLTSPVPLCGQDAEWIVEDNEEEDSFVTLTNFGTVTFTNAVASGPGGTTYTPSGATIVEIVQDHQVVTSVSTGESSVTIQYVYTE